MRELELNGLRKLMSAQVWAVMPDYLEAMMDVLLFRANGGHRSAEEISQRLAAAQHGALGKGERPVSPSSGAIAVIPLHGLIAQRASMVNNVSGPAGTSIEEFGDAYETAMNDDAISAIVIDADSPGGTINGVPEQAAKMFGMRGTKRTIAVANGLMASAAYWLCSAADEIVCTPSGDVGGIGVYTVHTDLSEAMGREGMKQTVVKAGKYKAEGHPSVPLSDEARTALQDRVDEAYTAFTGAVAEHRGVKRSDIANGYGEGRALSATKAKSSGLVDRVATLSDVITRLSSPKGGPKPGSAKGGKRADFLRRELEVRNARVGE